MVVISFASITGFRQSFARTIAETRSVVVASAAAMSARTESARIQVLKRDGSRQEFDRRKLASAIGKGASRQLTPDAIDRLIDDLEATIRQSGASEVASGRIGQMVLDRLAEQDPMGYLRFKIVYANLQDTDALYDELESLIRVRQ